MGFVRRIRICEDTTLLTHKLCVNLWLCVQSCGVCMNMHTVHTFLCACLLTVSVSDDFPCGRQSLKTSHLAASEFPTGIWSPSGLVCTPTVPSYLPSIKPTMAFKSGNSSNRTLSSGAWLCFLESSDLEHLHVKRNSTKNNLFHTSNAPGYLFQMYMCVLWLMWVLLRWWESPSNFLLCVCKPLIIFCTLSCCSESNISNKAIVHLVMQPMENR